MVIEVDFPVGREEGVGELPGGAVEAVVDQRLQTVRVVDRVEACEEQKQLQCTEQGKPARTQTSVNLWYLTCFPPYRARKGKINAKQLSGLMIVMQTAQPCDDPGFRAVPRGHKRVLCRKER